MLISQPQRDPKVALAEQTRLIEQTKVAPPLNLPTSAPGKTSWLTERRVNKALNAVSSASSAEARDAAFATLVDLFLSTQPQYKGLMALGIEHLRDTTFEGARRAWPLGLGEFSIGSSQPLHRRCFAYDSDMQDKYVVALRALNRLAILAEDQEIADAALSALDLHGRDQAWLALFARCPKLRVRAFTELETPSDQFSPIASYRRFVSAIPIGEAQPLLKYMQPRIEEVVQGSCPACGGIGYKQERSYRLHNEAGETRTLGGGRAECAECRGNGLALWVVKLLIAVNAKLAPKLSPKLSPKPGNG